ncbi:MAG TPA: P1 family peptidase, partial [Gemmatimonadaceae bacterium]|nr:P1 family peptidase [Gemmatimonadaceae bacterium]
MRTVTLAMLALALAAPVSLAQDVAPLAPGRARARALGVAPGIFRPGAVNAITDVVGVRVGHTTLIVGDSVRTGVTAILPHEGNAFLERVPAAMYVGNGFGKLLGVTQVRELGELETPILLTCTLCVWRAADGLVGWMLERPGMQRVRSINPVVGETNDGGLNAIRSRPVDASAVRQALDGARTGPVTEGSVGAGTGTTAFGWKGGIGTSSRLLPSSLGGWTVGVLVQSNFGGVLQVLGAPVGKELGRYAYRDAAERGDGSIMIVVATDAPLSDRNLRRLAARTMMGLARTGASASSGSGDYAIAFSTAAAVRRPWNAERLTTTELANEQASALFQAVIEATEEAILNSMCMASPMTGINDNHSAALPLEEIRRFVDGVRPIFKS